MTRATGRTDERSPVPTDTASEPSPPLAAAAALFFLSGFAALLYQVIWQRILGVFSGVHIYSVMMIVAAFMAGLGLGSLAGGRWADRLGRSRSILAFATCELGIGCFALISPWLYYDVAYLRLGFLARHGILLPAIHLLLLFVPTFLMGASLPLLSRGLVLRTESAGRVIGVLYGVNTLGAALGALTSVWWLIGSLGFVGTIGVGAVLNFVAAAGAFWIRRRLPEGREPVLPPASGGERVPAAAGGFGVGRWALLYALSGFIALSLEILWFRILDATIKSSPYIFGHLLGLFLLFLASGGLVGALVVHRARRPESVFLWGQWSISVLAVLALVGLSRGPSDWWPLNRLVEFWSQDSGIVMGEILAAWRQFTSGSPPGVLVVAALVWLVIPLAMMALPTFLMGFTYPFIQRAVQTDPGQVGWRVGLIQTSNIAGSMLGSLLTGGLLLTLLGTPRTLSLLALGGATFGGLAAWRGFRRAGATAAVLALSLALAAGVPGRDRFWARLHGQPPESLKVAEDASSVVVMQRLGEREAVIRVNGTGHSLLPHTGVWVWLGLLPTLQHPAAGEVLIIGMGTGGTAWAAGCVPEVQRIDLYEIAKPELEVLRLAQRDWLELASVDRLLADPRVNLVFGDGRLALRGEERRYDIIEADALSTEMAYSGNLYSREFFEEARQRLKPGGLMCSFVPTPRTGRTFVTVFPYVLELHIGGLTVMVGSNDPWRFDPAAVLSRLRSDAVQSCLAAAGDSTRLNAELTGLVSSARWVDEAGRRAAAEGDINTDLFPRDEYRQFEHPWP